jgi:hypothetical protein
MMAKGLVLREVPLLCGDKRSACAARSPLLCGDKRRVGRRDALVQYTGCYVRVHRPIMKLRLQSRPCG